MTCRCICCSGGSRPSGKAGGGEGGHPDPEISGGDSLQKHFFQPLWPQFGLKIRGGAGPPGSATVL